MNRLRQTDHTKIGSFFFGRSVIITLFLDTEPFNRLRVNDKPTAWKFHWMPLLRPDLIKHWAVHRIPEPFVHLVLVHYFCYVSRARLFHFLLTCHPLEVETLQVLIIGRCWGHLYIVSGTPKNHPSFIVNVAKLLNQNKPDKRFRNSLYHPV